MPASGLVPERSGAQPADYARVIGGRDLKIRGYVVGQFPNPPLWVALGALVVAIVAPAGSALEDIARAVLYSALVVWAYLEAAEGVNRFRRFLGLAGLLLAVYLIARAIG